MSSNQTIVTTVNGSGIVVNGEKITITDDDYDSVHGIFVIAPTEEALADEVRRIAVKGTEVVMHCGNKIAATELPLIPAVKACPCGDPKHILYEVKISE